MRIETSDGDGTLLPGHQTVNSKKGGPRQPRIRKKFAPLPPQMRDVPPGRVPFPIYAPNGKLAFVADFPVALVAKLRRAAKSQGYTAERFLAFRLDALLKALEKALEKDRGAA